MELFTMFCYFYKFVEAKSTNLFYFSQTIRLNFMSENISRIACTGFVKGSMTPFNNSIAVEIKSRNF